MTDPVIEAVTGPGGPFEIVVEDVLGVPLQVYKQRLGSLRDLVEGGDARVAVDFLVQGDRRFTFSELNALIRQAAVSLRDLGLRPGDRVAVVCANRVGWVVLFWACAVSGLVVVPLNAWWKREELEFALRDSGARLLFCDAKRWAAARDVVPILPDLAHVFVMDLDLPDDPARPSRELFRPEDPGVLPDVAVKEDDLLAILYTSGTTGRPKGATLTHRQALANLQNIACSAAIVAARSKGAGTSETRSDRPSSQPAHLLVVPLFHVTGCLATMIPAYASGRKVVLMPPGRFDADEAMATIEREKITNIGGVPTIMWRILDARTFGEHDLSSVTNIGYGGAPAAPELVARIAQAFPRARRGLATAYGLTETASIATAISGEDYVAHPGSVGRAAPTVEVRIVDLDGSELAAGVSGEVCLRGPTVMRHGYWNRPDVNEATFLAGGWFRTGDIGYLDDDGYLYLVDRAKDMIIRGGENVYCVEVEHILYEHPDVLDAAVVGVPHPQLGEEVKAVVQLRDGAAVTVEDLRDYCRERLADFKVPAYVEVRAEPLPRNPAGKVLKHVLREGRSASSFASSTADDSAL